MLQKFRKLLINPSTIWFTGLSGSGKTTLANILLGIIREGHGHAVILDGDVVRKRLNNDLGFEMVDRFENIRRIAEMCRLLNDQGISVIVASISPTNEIRNLAKNIIRNDLFKMIYIDIPIEICKKRDPKGLYEKVSSGKIKHFTGIHSKFEKPNEEDCLLILNGEHDIYYNMDKIIKELK